MEPPSEKEKKNESPKPAKTGSRGKNKKGKTGKHATKVKFSLRLKFSLAIITLTSIVVLIMTFYFIRREGQILRNEIIRFAEREIEHLTNTAQEAISAKDELTLIAAVKNVQKIKSVRYVYIFDPKGRIIQNFEPEKNGTLMPDDEITRKANENTQTENPLMLDYKDPMERGGSIYDFSKPVLHTVFKNRMATVRMGFPDKIIRDEIASMTRNILIIGVVFIGMSMIGSFLLAGVTIRPIRKLTEGAAIIGTGNLEYKIKLGTSDELGVLANEFNMMTDKLKQAKEMEIESRIMQEQLELAKEIQEGLNPMGYYEKEGVQIKGYTRAAKGVGGDYFDYIDISDINVGALISDVSGKGVPASLVMVMIRTVFTNSIKNNSRIDCATIVRSINDALSADFAIDKFATLFFMIYNRATNELSFSNAGHGPLFCYRSTLGKCTVTALEGVPIGIMEDVEYSQGKVKLNPGDIVVLYTDGVSEMRNEEKEEYGRLRLQKLLIANNQLNAEELVEKIVTDVDTFRGEASPHDDMTTLVLKRVS